MKYESVNLILKILLFLSPIASAAFTKQEKFMPAWNMKKERVKAPLAAPLTFAGVPCTKKEALGQMTANEFWFKMNPINEKG